MITLTSTDRSSSFSLSLAAIMYSRELCGVFSVINRTHADDAVLLRVNKVVSSKVLLDGIAHASGMPHMYHSMRAFVDNPHYNHVRLVYGVDAFIVRSNGSCISTELIQKRMLGCYHSISIDRSDGHMVLTYASPNTLLLPVSNVLVVVAQMPVLPCIIRAAVDRIHRSTNDITIRNSNSTGTLIELQASYLMNAGSLAMYLQPITHGRSITPYVIADTAYVVTDDDIILVPGNDLDSARRIRINGRKHVDPYKLDTNDIVYVPVSSTDDSPMVVPSKIMLVEVNNEEVNNDTL